MHPILKNVLAVIAGLGLGMLVNGGLVSISGELIPLPEGVDPNDMESLKANIHRFGPQNFIMPFLAHALGTLAGAWICAKLAANRKLLFALIIGGFFLIGGIMMSFELPGPTWFAVLDLGLAYLPMAWLGARLNQ